MGFEMADQPRTDVATLGGGCFWCLQPLFQELRGVTKVEVGYSGGTSLNPSYEHVCTGETGHAEVVQVAFDPGEISYENVLRVFFSVHDPTTQNRQGPDVGTQYRSTILFHTPDQRAAATRVIEEIRKEGLWDDPIVTEILPFSTFYRAEEYHQDYFAKNPWAGYCRAVIKPKVAKFRKTFADRLRKPAMA